MDIIHNCKLFESILLPKRTRCVRIHLDENATERENRFYFSFLDKKIIKAFQIPRKKQQKKKKMKETKRKMENGEKM